MHDNHPGRQGWEDSELKREMGSGMVMSWGHCLPRIEEDGNEPPATEGPTTVDQVELAPAIVETPSDEGATQENPGDWRSQFCADDSYPAYVCDTIITY